MTEDEDRTDPYETLAREDVKRCVEAFLLDADGTLRLGAHERRFWLAKLVNAQNYLGKVRPAA